MRPVWMQLFILDEVDNLVNDSETSFNYRNKFQLQWTSKMYIGYHSPAITNTFFKTVTFSVDVFLLCGVYIYDAFSTRRCNFKYHR